MHASGFAAVYVAALVLGNAELPAPGGHPVVRRGGRLAGPDRAVRDARAAALAGPDHPRHVGLAVVAGLLLTFVARPVSVVVSAVALPMPLAGPARFLSWAGLRGAVPIVLTTIPLSEGVDGAGRLFDLVFVMVVIYTLLTGPTLPTAARLLRVARRSEPRGLDVEAAPLERIAADLLQVSISPRVADARRRGRRAPAAGRGLGGDGDPGRRDAGAGAPYRAAPRRRPADGHPAQAARGDRAAAAAGLRGWPAGAVARPASRRRHAEGGAAATGGLQTSCGPRPGLRGRLAASCRSRRPPRRRTPGPGGRLPAYDLVPAPRWLATRWTAGLPGSSVQISTRSTSVPLGALPSQPSWKPASVSRSIVSRPGRAGPGVVDADGDVAAGDLVALGELAVLADRCVASPGTAR